VITQKLLALLLLVATMLLPLVAVVSYHVGVCVTRQALDVAND